MCHEVVVNFFFPFFDGVFPAPGQLVSAARAGALARLPVLALQCTARQRTAAPRAATAP